MPFFRGRRLRWLDLGAGTAESILAFERPAGPSDPDGVRGAPSPALTCVMSTGAEATLTLPGRLVLASNPLGYDGTTLTLPPNTTAWIAPRSG